MGSINDLISYDISSSLGILTPDYYPVEVFVNNKSNGLHYYLSRIDESFLRKNNRIPGSIYSGDTISIDDPLNLGLQKKEVTISGVDGVSLLWNDERMWTKDSSRNFQSRNNRDDIKYFINAVNNPNAVEFMQQFETVFDKEKFYNYFALDSLTGTYHHDYFHNHKIYFDPYKGKFEPIEWDLRFWTSYHPKDIIETPLLKQIIFNPILEFERDKVLLELLEKYSASNMNSIISKASNKIYPLLKQDHLRSYSMVLIPETGDDVHFPFSMEQYDNSVEMLQLLL